MRIDMVPPPPPPRIFVQNKVTQDSTVTEKFGTNSFDVFRFVHSPTEKACSFEQKYE